MTDVRASSCAASPAASSALRGFERTVCTLDLATTTRFLRRWSGVLLYSLSRSSPRASYISSCESPANSAWRRMDSWRYSVMMSIAQRATRQMIQMMNQSDLLEDMNMTTVRPMGRASRAMKPQRMTLG